MTLIELTKKQVRKLKRKHHGLRAEIVKTGWWIFGTREYEIRCSCGYVDDRRIPLLPIEASMVTEYLIELRMDEHIEDALKRKDW